MKQRQRTVFVIHTSSVVVADITALFKEMLPEVTVRNIVDESMLPEVIAEGRVTDRVAHRLCEYALLAELAGADAIMNLCSSVGEAADRAKQLVKVPLIRIDERMAETACREGERIGVVATLPTTLGPTTRLVRRTAETMGKKVCVIDALAEGAFDRVVSGDRAGHNRIVIDSIKNLYDRVDVVVCAQASMAALIPDLGQTPVPVLTSPRLGVEHMKDVLHSVQQ